MLEPFVTAYYGIDLPNLGPFLDTVSIALDLAGTIEDQKYLDKLVAYSASGSGAVVYDIHSRAFGSEYGLWMPYP